MKTRILKPLAVVVASVLAAVVFHIGWLVGFIPSAKSGIVTLKVLGWMAAPVATGLGYATGLWMGERRLTTRKADFQRIVVWPLAGCTLGAVALCWIGPMWFGIGTLAGGAASVLLREVRLLSGHPHDHTNKE